MRPIFGPNGVEPYRPWSEERKTQRRLDIAAKKANMDPRFVEACKLAIQAIDNELKSNKLFWTLLEARDEFKRILASQKAAQQIIDEHAENKSNIVS